VLSTHGRSGVSRLVAGSVTTAVVRDATRPVAIVPPLYEPEAPE
jgi:nucleotide-binding universal stress UspA family protein